MFFIFSMQIHMHIFYKNELIVSKCFILLYSVIYKISRVTKYTLPTTSNACKTLHCFEVLWYSSYSIQHLMCFQFFIIIRGTAVKFLCILDFFFQLLPWINPSIEFVSQGKEFYNKLPNCSHNVYPNWTSCPGVFVCCFCTSVPILNL